MGISRTDRYKYIRNLLPGETEELYDMKNDPEELVNLARIKESSFGTKTTGPYHQELEKQTVSLPENAPSLNP